MESLRKKKILFILPWAQHGAAGIEKNTALVVNRMSKEHSITVAICAHPSTDYKTIRTLFVDGINVSIHASKRARGSFGFILQTIHAMQPDVIVSNVLHISAMSIVAQALIKKRVFIISVNHGMDFHSLRNRILARFVHYYSDNIVTTSQLLKENLMRTLHVPEKEIHVIYNAFDIKSIAENSREPIPKSEQNTLNGKTIIITVGRLDNYQKSLDILLEAFSIFAEKQENALLLIIGDGPDKEKLVGRAKQLDINNKTIFLGWKQNPFPYIALSNTLALSSNFEGFGRVLVEALAVGTQVVSTDCPSGPSEILANGKYGRLTPLNDPESFAEALLQSLKNPIPREMLKQRAQFFSIEKAVGQYRELFKKIS